MKKKKVIIELGALRVILDGDFENAPEVAIDLFERAAKCGQISPSVQKTQSSDIAITGTSNNSTNYDFSVESIAAKTGVSSAPELAKSAGLYLKFVKGKDEFDRSELLSAMKTATAYYKESMRANLSVTVNNLVKSGCFLKRSSEKFSIGSQLIKEGSSTLDSIK